MELINRSLLDIPSDDNEWEELVRFADDVANAPTVEAIPKDQYEARLKAEKVYLLKDVRKEVLNKISQLNMMQYNLGLQDALEIVDQYISAEQENEDATN